MSKVNISIDVTFSRQHVKEILQREAIQLLIKDGFNISANDVKATVKFDNGDTVIEDINFIQTVVSLSCEKAVVE